MLDQKLKYFEEPGDTHLCQYMRVSQQDVMG